MMNHSRRQFFRQVAGGVALAAIPQATYAQEYPSRPVRWLLGYTAGGTTDIISRLVTQPLTERLGQPFVIEPRPGAGTNLATEFVVRAAPDGYTLLFVGAPNAINASLYSNLNFNFVRDIAPVAGIASVPMVLIVHPSVPATTIPELLAYAKANPRKINMASSGIGTTPHLAGELFRMMAGVDIQHIPYRGAAPAITDLLAGQVQLYFSTTPSSMEYIRTGRVRGLAVTTADPAGRASGPAGDRRIRSRLRGKRMVRRRRAKRDVPADRGQAQPRDQRGAGRHQDEGEVRRSRLCLDRKLTRGIRQDDRRGNREVGQGRQVRGPAPGLIGKSSRPLAAR